MEHLRMFSNPFFLTSHTIHHNFSPVDLHSLVYKLAVLISLIVVTTRVTIKFALVVVMLNASAGDSYMLEGLVPFPHPIPFPIAEGVLDLVLILISGRAFPLASW